MDVKSESEVAQSCLTLSDPMDCSLPGSSVHGIVQARALEWGAIAFRVYPSPNSGIREERLRWGVPTSLRGPSSGGERQACL